MATTKTAVALPNERATKLINDHLFPPEAQNLRITPEQIAETCELTIRQLRGKIIAGEITLHEAFRRFHAQKQVVSRA